MKRLQGMLIIITLLAASLFLVSCSAESKQEEHDMTGQAVTIEQLSQQNDGSLYLNDVIWLDEGCIIDLTRIESFPVIILNYDEKTSVAFEMKGKQTSYEIPTTGRYIFFSIVNGALKCINDDLAIEYPDAPHSEVILL